MMNTKILMVSSSVFLVVIGFFCSFMPDEILSFLNAQKLGVLSLLIQIMGALYFGFAILNWTAKANIIGGIYSKVSLGNFLHFLIGALTLLKYFSKHAESSMLLIPLIIYGLFAIAFGLVSFGQHKFKKA